MLPGTSLRAFLRDSYGRAPHGLSSTGAGQASKPNMIRACIGVLLALLFAVAHADTSGQQLAETAGRSLVGQPAPRLVLTTIDGAKIDLGELYGRKAAYLKFWATWCVPCREQDAAFRTYL